MRIKDEKHKAKRIGHKRYLYRGFEIQGYEHYTLGHQYAWEAIDYDNSAFAQSYSLRECKREIDEEIEKECLKANSGKTRCESQLFSLHEMEQL